MHSDVTALSKASIWQEASRVINEEGFRAFWKGNLVTIAHRLPYSSVSFYAYERYKSASAYNPFLSFCFFLSQNSYRNSIN
jgi:solute carrier family 25 phosphate transporter 23/24/25/41